MAGRSVAPAAPRQGDELQERRAGNVNVLVVGYIRDYADPVIAIARVDRSAAAGETSSGERTRRLARSGRNSGTCSATERTRTADRRQSVVAVTAGRAGRSAASSPRRRPHPSLRHLGRPRRRAARAARGRRRLGGRRRRLHGSARGTRPGRDRRAPAAFNAMTRALEEGRGRSSTRTAACRRASTTSRRSSAWSPTSSRRRSRASSASLSLHLTSAIRVRRAPPLPRDRRPGSAAARSARGGLLDVRLLEEGTLRPRARSRRARDLRSEQVLLFFATSDLAPAVVDQAAEPAQSSTATGERPGAAPIGNLLLERAQVHTGRRQISARISVVAAGAAVGLRPRHRDPAEAPSADFERLFRVDAPRRESGHRHRVAVARDIWRLTAARSASSSAEGEARRSGSSSAQPNERLGIRSRKLPRRRVRKHGDQAAGDGVQQEVVAVATIVNSMNGG